MTRQNFYHSLKGILLFSPPFMGDSHEEKQPPRSIQRDQFIDSYDSSCCEIDNTVLGVVAKK